MLDYYYQLLNVPKGTTGKSLAKGFVTTKAAYLSESKSKKDIELLDKAYEILSNVRVTKEKVIDKAGQVQFEYKFHPNPEFYQTFYDRINSIKIEKRKVREKEYKGKLTWIYRFITLCWLLLGIVMVVGPIHWAYSYDNWPFLIFFSPLFYGTYFMYFKTMNWRKFRFEKNGDWL